MLRQPLLVCLASLSLVLVGPWVQAATPLPVDAGASPATSAPGAAVRPGAVARSVPMRLPDAAPAWRIELGASTAADLEGLAARNRRTLAPGSALRGVPLAIGYPRRIAAERPWQDVTWTTLEGGARVARIEVDSTGARALRVALALAGNGDGVSVRVSAPGATDAAAVLSGREIAQATSRDGVLWSPMVDGASAILEVEVAAGVDPAQLALRLPRVSHLVVNGADLLSPRAPIARATGIGTAEACEVDAACVLPTDAALQTLSRAVARIVFEVPGGAALCTATLLNDTAQSNTPYLFTANHCIDSQAAASSIQSYFFFTAVSCDSKSTPPFALLTGGGRLLGRSQDHDWALIQLTATPPAGTYLSSWRAEPLPTGASVVSLHHPSGDLLKVSRGNVTGSLFVEDDLVSAPFTEVVWSSGVTEGGSSGGHIATFNGAAYEVRGGLYGGLALCSRPKDPDYFSGLESALPVMRQYLTPGVANPGGVVVAVEFYHSGLDHYFISTNPVEIDNLDSGRTVGWVRTGLRFLAYPTQVEGTSPVCRFYREPAYGDSHFYSASPAECAATAAAHPVDWVYESPAVFYIQVPNAITGACAAGTTPVYRYFNAFTTNHRYTIERVIAGEMRSSPWWTAEGYGPGPYYPVMCAVLQSG